MPVTVAYHTRIRTPIAEPATVKLVEFSSIEEAKAAPLPATTLI